jgi:hypothetical protein
MSESNLYKTFKRNWKGYIKRMESSGIGAGFPDCHLVNSKKNDVFLELKYLAKPFVHKKLYIRNTQLHWFLSYPGRFAYMLFKIDKTFYLFNQSVIYDITRKIKWDDFVSKSCLKTKKCSEIVDFLNNKNS